MTEVRYAVASDLPALTEIYNHYVVHSAATFDTDPFSVEARQEWYDHYRDTGPHRLVVATRDDAVIGYATSSPLRPRRAYDRSIEVSAYLRPDLTQGGIGSALYRRLFDDLSGEGLHRAYAVIALPNEASVALHRKFEFVEMGTMNEVGHKFGKWWDVLWMERRLPT